MVSFILYTYLGIPFLYTDKLVHQTHPFRYWHYSGSQGSASTQTELPDAVQTV